MDHDVFVSYSSKDKPVADAVCAMLEGRGTRCWIAPRDILPGRDWGEAIVEAIQHSQVMVLVFSKSANASQQVKREVERAVNRGVIIVPFRIEEVQPSKNLEYFLGTPHWLDALTRPLERHLEYLADTVARLMGGEAPVPRPEPAKVAPRFSPVQVLSAAAALVAVAVLLALWLGRGSGEAAPEVAGHWELQPVAGGPSRSEFSFEKDGSYEVTAVFQEEGTIVDWSPGGDVRLPIAHTDGGTRQLALTPGGGAMRVMVYTPDPEDGSIAGGVSGLIPNEVMAFSFSGKAPGDWGVAYATDWERVSDTEWKLTGTLGDLKWHFTFTARDGRYTFTAKNEQEGTYEASDGQLRIISDSGLITEATYSLTPGGDLALSTATGAGLWKRAP